VLSRETQLRREHQVMDTVLQLCDSLEQARLLSVSPQLVLSWRRSPETDDEFSTGKFGPPARLRALISMIRTADRKPDRAYPHRPVFRRSPLRRVWSPAGLSNHRRRRNHAGGCQSPAPNRRGHRGGPQGMVRHDHHHPDRTDLRDRQPSRSIDQIFQCQDQQLSQPAGRIPANQGSIWRKKGHLPEDAAPPGPEGNRPMKQLIALWHRDDLDKAVSAVDSVARGARPRSPSSGKRSSRRSRPANWKTANRP